LRVEGAGCRVQGSGLRVRVEGWHPYEEVDHFPRPLVAGASFENDDEGSRCTFSHATGLEPIDCLRENKSTQWAALLFRALLVNECAARHQPSARHEIAFFRSLICTDARWNSVVCGTHQGPEKCNLIPLWGLLAGENISRCGFS
jgi:hypothetical protein